MPIADTGGMSDVAAETRFLAGPELPADGRVRVVIAAVQPSIDHGRFAAKCVAGEPFEVSAHVFTDGHDQVRARLQWRPERQDDGSAWREVEMSAAGNDEWTACFVPPAPGRYRYRVAAWVDALQSWRRELARRVEPEDIQAAARVGARLLADAAERAGPGPDVAPLLASAQALQAGGAAPSDPVALKALALDATLAQLADRHPDRSLQLVHPAEPLPLVADRLRARYSSWYELFPRSASPEPGRHGTFADVEARLPYIAEMGFNVLYLPPIHPIGRERRKGRNNTLQAEAGDVGSPWAIGAAEGGHLDILPALGTADDFRRLVNAAKERGIDLAMDIAFQCAPDHPWVAEHPDWFRHRPDGSVQYAENPPKKYQDIYPFDFECQDWRGLWQALKSVFEHWIAQGVTIFRVDNPHTKSFAFWEWVIAELRQARPELIFLAEAFTRPKVMHRLAKLGFTQSYTYFTWRHSRQELTDYFTELSQGPGRHYFRPNVWPNTPDILSEQLHGANRAMFSLRLVLASLLAASYGLYGPAYELLENRPAKPGSEEYLDSEKYQLRHWQLDAPDSLRNLIARLNRLRREHPALQDNAGLHFHASDNDKLLVWSKHDHARRDLMLVVLNLDPQQIQVGWVDLDLAAMQLAADRPFRVDDLLNDQHFLWQGPHNFVILDPARTPAHVFHVRPHPRNELDFKDFA
ncbi:alpha-1,4-glucan--maltose-1-phosphate maltosyltransferase [Ideonella azotifigens]|uniref:Alpha-1,4-glucan:maltose-1-phosphate maltosyltransferase n=2 Tax=Ideonella azotifigens TaxID=513160 RepID=A0ABN1KK65_9BURK|nr:alpha-1,4-glucan--maltose-1-phosphate maltosyltransferase [Ideonella azotifigens]MCD2339279.1 alpha-1,4-glucan--maltose-1-phosphate maltosyltransferase [Ideonella azotifigens]